MLRVVNFSCTTLWLAATSTSSAPKPMHRFSRGHSGHYLAPIQGARLGRLRLSNGIEVHTPTINANIEDKKLAMLSGTRSEGISISGFMSIGSATTVIDPLLQSKTLRGIAKTGLDASRIQRVSRHRTAFLIGMFEALARDIGCFPSIGSISSIWPRHRKSSIARAAIRSVALVIGTAVESHTFINCCRSRNMTVITSTDIYRLGKPAASKSRVVVGRVSAEETFIINASISIGCHNRHRDRANVERIFTKPLGLCERWGFPGRARRAATSSA